MSNTGDPLLRQVRKRIAISYGHKAVLFALAAFGFTSLHWLGDQKKRYEEQSSIRWTVTKDLRTAIKRATGQSICAAFEEQSSPKEPDDWCVKEAVYETREQLISALQDVAEAPAWDRFSDSVSDARMELEKQLKAASSTEKTQIRARFADVVAKEEAYAKASANAFRRSAGARLAAMDIKGFVKPEATEEPAKGFFEELIQPTLDTSSDTHVIYQILWYASLLLGVVASSMLVVIVFTALPITDAEGYWTKRIGEIVERRPGSVKRSIAAPLLTAALAGGTIAGTVMATEPGGNARPSVEPSLQGDQGYRVGPSTRTDPPKKAPDNSHQEPPAVSPEDLSVKLGEINAVLDKLSTALGVGFSGVADDLGNTKRDVIGEVRTVESKVADRVSPTVNAVKQKVTELRVPVEDTYDMTHVALGSVTGTRQDVGTLSKNVEKQACERKKEAEDIQRKQAWQENTVKRSLAQNAQSDPRGFLGRTFGPTLFQVGPLVIETMDARLGELGASSAEREALHNALTAMQEQERNPEIGAESRRAFKKRLRTELLKSGEVSQSQAESIIDDHFAALLRICALPR